MVYDGQDLHIVCECDKIAYDTMFNDSIDTSLVKIGTPERMFLFSMNNYYIWKNCFTYNKILKKK